MLPKYKQFEEKISGRDLLGDGVHARVFDYTETSVMAITRNRHKVDYWTYLGLVVNNYGFCNPYGKGIFGWYSWDKRVHLIELKRLFRLKYSTEYRDNRLLNRELDLLEQYLGDYKCSSSKQLRNLYAHIDEFIIHKSIIEYVYNRGNIRWALDTGSGNYLKDINGVIIPTDCFHFRLHG